MMNRLLSMIRGFADLRLLPQDLRRIKDQTARLQDQSGLSVQLLANAERDRLLATEQIADPRRLEKFGFKGYSQNDENGIIQEIFERIGTTDRRFVEFGTGNGLENNTVFLLCLGWSGLWLDGSETDHQHQHQNFGWAIKQGLLTCVRDFLTINNINSVIGDAGFRGQIDLLSIDVDGNDYHLWKAIDVVQPRVVVIEYNAYAPPLPCTGSWSTKKTTSGTAKAPTSIRRCSHCINWEAKRAIHSWAAT
jgi:hypothetical protein